MRYRNIIFDVDGTLLDTSGGIVSAVKHTLNKIGIFGVTEETLLSFIGPPIQESLKNNFLLSNKEIQNGTKIFREFYKSYELYNAKVYEGILELLSFIKEDGGQIGIATYKREDYAIDILKYFKIAPFCNCIYGSDDKGSLTKQDIVEKCIASSAINNRRDCVLIGDSHYDALGAQNAEIDFIAVTYGFGFKCKGDVRYKNVGIADSVDKIRNYY